VHTIVQVSALGTFFLGGGVSMTHAVGELMHPSVTTEVAKEVWGVLILSFCVDGYVFGKTVQEMVASRRIDGDGINKDMSFWKYATTKVRDPATLAVLLEDGAACLGIVFAIGGIGLTHYTGMAVFDGIAGVGISGLLLAMGVALANMNHRFLIGQGLDKTTREDIEQIILTRRSIDNVFSIQSQWTGPDTFSFKAEVDFDGTFLAAKLLPRYEQEFFDAKNTLDRDLRVLLSWYAEDVMRLVEREVRHIEEEIRMKYPAAQYIELEPMSKDVDRYAIDDGMEAQLRRVEIESLNRYLKSLYKIKEGDAAGTGNGTSSTNN
jgi:zinc transporter 9